MSKLKSKKIEKLMWCQPPNDLIFNRPLLEKLLKEYITPTYAQVHVKVKRINTNTYLNQGEFKEEVIEDNLVYFEIGIETKVDD